MDFPVLKGGWTFYSPMHTRPIWTYFWVSKTGNVGLYHLPIGCQEYSPLGIVKARHKDKKIKISSI